MKKYQENFRTFNSIQILIVMEDPDAMDKNMKECLINKLKSQMDSVELYGMMILSF